MVDDGWFRSGSAVIMDWIEKKNLNRSEAKRMQALQLSARLSSSVGDGWEGWARDHYIRFKVFVLSLSLSLHQVPIFTPILSGHLIPLPSRHTIHSYPPTWLPPIYMDP